MSPKCFIPVLPVGEQTVPNHFFGYDQESDAPYVLEITLDDYYAGTVGHLGEIAGMVMGNVLAHPFALHSCEWSARLALDDVIMLRETK